MSEFVEQVRREAGRARRIPSAHVVPVFDAGRIENGPFYVEMAVCADPDEEAPGSIRIGRSLREAQPGLSPEEAARLVEDLAGAVHAAHRTGVVHGDVKPENVLLTPESRRVMLADFGIATSLAAANPGSVGSGAGRERRPGGGAPGRCPSARWPTWPRSSGAIGCRPRRRRTSTRSVERSTSSSPARRRTPAASATPTRRPPPLPAGVPPRLREIVARALAPRPEDRPGSAGALAEELRRYRAPRADLARAALRGWRRTTLFLRRHRASWWRRRWW